MKTIVYAVPLKEMFDPGRKIVGMLTVCVVVSKMFMLVFLVLSSLLATSYTAASHTLEIDVCTPNSRQSSSVNLVHRVKGTPNYGACSCRITAGSDVTIKTEPGNRCVECWNGSKDARTCIIHCEKSKNKPYGPKTLSLHNGTIISIAMTNINGTILSLKATKGNLKVQCGQTDPVTCTANKIEEQKGGRPECAPRRSCEQVSQQAYGCW
ncbi:uncharacterized protein LOC124269466 isoform X2 [Haliotis rubra]|uniref:uncharacterized protein LOC124269466 isoform X2 n=1 Tax=Haliotis rubra TaxID=36100 RepID=UPI001EE557B8|nr:uncharacterized protein LOC124269466 isoform X2 [Haliotis rubra]